MSLAVGSTFGSTLAPTAYWYLARGTGAVALVLLTASVVIGIVGSMRFVAERWPRFAIETVHRDVSLLVLVVLVIHIITSVLDGFAPITLVDGVLPFRTPYRPLWMGLGTLSFDLLVAIAITSIVRRRIGYRAWRTVHWLAYASWPVAVLHGLGTGSDVKQWWMLGLTVVCVVAVLVAVWIRIASASEHAALRAPATALAVITPIGLMIFTIAGPLQKGWARRAGTPASLLGHAPPGASASGGGSTSSSGGGGGNGALSSPFTANVAGTLRESAAPGGAVVDISLSTSGQVRGRLRIRIVGAPIGGGGLQMTGSQVDLAAAGVPSVYQGSINFLQGTEFRARVADSQGSALDLHGVLQIDNQSNQVTGTLSGTPA